MINLVYFFLNTIQSSVTYLYSVASTISNLWGIVTQSTENCRGFENNVKEIHLPCNMTYKQYRREFIYLTFRHF
jgi:hypothetical protein